MGKALSKVSRSLKNFNIDNRTQKRIARIEQQKITESAPRPSVIRKIQVDNEAKESLLQKDGNLLSMLKHVKVDSFGATSEIKSKAKLPQERSKVEDFDFGFKDPQFVPKGKCSLRQAVEFLNNNIADPKTYSATHIANEYKLDLVKTQQVLEHFKTFNVRYPEKAGESQGFIAGIFVTPRGDDIRASLAKKFQQKTSLPGRNSGGSSSLGSGNTQK